MRSTIFAAAAAAALLAAPAVFAQTSGQADTSSSPTMNSAHANAPSNSGQPGYTTTGAGGSTTRPHHRTHHSTTGSSSSSSSGGMGTSQPDTSTSNTQPH
jgi:hypothetical protein